jgi:RNA polymerase sigma factor (sigma-70 family)
MAPSASISRALSKLPRRQRQIVAMRYLADFSEQTTAQRLGISLGAVKSGASRGLESLRAHMKHITSEELS